MKSMTGFGFGEYQDEQYHLSVDLKSYNNRYLDIVVNLPTPLNPLEPAIRSFLGERIERGRVEIYLKMRELEEDLQVILDRKSIQRYVAALEEVKGAAGITEEITLEHLLKMEGVMKTERKRDLETIEPIVFSMLEKAAADYEASRVKEGASTQKDILQQIRILEDYTRAVTDRIPEMEEQLKNGVKTRVAEIGLGEVEESRILSEAAMLLVRYDVNEEVARLASHLVEFRRIAALKEPVGKRLDFLCQEINREINTLGSKTMLLSVQQDVVEMKNALEKIREQLRNVE